jgi:hypothetical protein
VYCGSRDWQGASPVFAKVAWQKQRFAMMIVVTEMQEEFSIAGL